MMGFSAEQGVIAAPARSHRNARRPKFCLLHQCVIARIRGIDAFR